MTRGSTSIGLEAHQATSVWRPAAQWGSANAAILSRSPVSDDLGRFGSNSG